MSHDAMSNAASKKPNGGRPFKKKIRMTTPEIPVHAISFGNILYFGVPYSQTIAVKK